jgi:tetratricopeptide (TPR) repeat protein
MLFKNEIMREGIVFVVLCAAVFGLAFSFIPQEKNTLNKTARGGGAYSLASGTPLPVDEQKNLRRDIETIAKQIASGNKRGADTFAPQYIHIAGAYEALDMSAQAKNAYNRALLEDEKNKDALFGLAHIAIREGDANKTEELYRRVIAFYEKDPQGYAALADFYVHILQHEERARATYLRGLLSTNNASSLARAYALFLEDSNRNYEAYLYWSGMAKEDAQNQEARVHMNALRPSVQDAITASEQAGKKSVKGVK